MTPVESSPRNPQPPWYHDGLAFECTRCGNCCRGEPGYVWVDLPRIEAIAAHLERPLDDFTRRFVRRVGSRFSLVERPDGDCVFWNADVGCTIYPARPIQCRTWPFWPLNVATPAAWNKLRETCPGAGRGPLHDLLQIEHALKPKDPLTS